MSDKTNPKANGGNPFVAPDLSFIEDVDFSAVPEVSESLFEAPTRDEAISAGKALAEALAEKLSPFKVYVFGSAVKGLANESSDIDVAIVSDKFEGDYSESDRNLVAFRAYEINARLECHTYSFAQWDDASLYMPEEIRKTGVLVYDA